MPWVWVPDTYTNVAATGTATHWYNQPALSTIGNAWSSHVNVIANVYITSPYNAQRTGGGMADYAPPAAPAIVRETGEAAARRVKEAADRLAAANAKAEGLLRQFLDPVQAFELEARGYFDVVGRLGRYRIRRGKIANIDVIDGGDVVQHRLCIHPRHARDMPVADVMVAQLLHLRANENEVLRIANKHPPPMRDPMRDQWLAEHEERANRMAL